MKRAGRLRPVIASLLALAGCVPDVVFVGDDAGSGGGSGGGSVCVDDAGASGICCPHGIICVGSNCSGPTACDRCVMSCNSGDVCCLKGATPTCNGPC